MTADQQLEQIDAMNALLRRVATLRKQRTHLAPRGYDASPTDKAAICHIETYLVHQARLLAHSIAAGLPK